MLSTHANHRALRVTAALLSPDEEGDIAIIENGIRRALPRDRASAPGDDGISYAVLCVFLKVSGNPLLQLYSLCFPCIGVG